MSSVLIIAVVFITVSMSMSWVVGHKERETLSEKLEETEVNKKSVEDELAKTRKNLEDEIVRVRKAKEELQKELAEKAKAEEALLQTEKKLEATGEDVKRLTKMAHIDEEEAKEVAIEEAKKRAERESDSQGKIPMPNIMALVRWKSTKRIMTKTRVRRQSNKKKAEKSKSIPDQAITQPTVGLPHNFPKSHISFL